MNRFKNLNDEELKSLLQNNQPVPPQAEPVELNTLLRNLNIDKKSVSESASGWLWLVTGLAASLFMFHFITSNPAATPAPITPTAAVVAQTKNAETETLATNTVTKTEPEPPASNEEDDVYTEADIHTLDIGEEYLTLAGF